MPADAVPQEGERTLTLANLKVMVDMLRPSYEDEQLRRAVEAEVITGDIMETAHRLGLGKVTLRAARAIATDIQRDQEFGYRWDRAR